MSVFDTFGLSVGINGRQFMFDPSITPQERTVTIPAAAAAAAAGAVNDDNNLPFSGGGQVNRIPPNTAYANLCRPKSLPPPHSKDVESFHQQGGFQAKNFFLNIHYGSLSIHYKVQPMHPRLTMNISVIKNGNGDEEEAENEVEEKKETNTAFPSCLQLFLEKHGEFNYADGEVWNLFYNLRQMNAMVCRAVHRFYRCHAVDFGLSNKKLLEHVREIVDRRYIDKSWYAEKLDLTIAWVDVEFNMQCNDMADRVVKVGEALEGAGRFLDAALVYKCVAELLMDKQITNSTQHIDASMAFGFCGLAYRRGDDWSNAERYYVRALHVHPNVLDFDNDGHLKVNILNLLNVYPSDAPRNVIAAKTVLIGLLYVVGYQPPSSLASKPYNPVAQSGKQAREVLNPIVRKVMFAKKALQESARAGNDVEQWRAKLLSFVRKGHGNGMFKVTDNNPTTDDKPATSQRKQDKTAARDVISSSKQGKCCNPECGIIKEYASFRRCPCHTVLYCGRDCQVAHWKEEHKLSCPLRKKKNAETTTTTAADNVVDAKQAST